MGQRLSCRAAWALTSHPAPRKRRSALLLAGGRINQPRVDHRTALVHRSASHPPTDKLSPGGLAHLRRVGGPHLTSRDPARRTSARLWAEGSHAWPVGHDCLVAMRVVQSVSTQTVKALAREPPCAAGLRLKRSRPRDGRSAPRLFRKDRPLGWWRRPVLVTRW
jgi:hypothetical protein